MKNLYDLRVAQVIDSYDIVINAGYEDEISQNMTFLLYSLEEEVLDPETGESLGQLEKVKGTVSVKHIQQKLSIATSNEINTIRVPKSGLNALAMMSSDTEERRVKAKLRDPAVGDRVRRIS